MSFDDTLTQAEKDADTFLEWSDATIARCVRDTAKKMKDNKGDKAIFVQSALNVLAEVMRQANAETMKLDSKGDRSGEPFRLQATLKFTRRKSTKETR